MLARAALPGGLHVIWRAQVVRRVDERDVRKGLWEITELAAHARIIHLRQQPNIVSQFEQMRKQLLSLGFAPCQYEVVHILETAGDKRSLSRG